MGQIIDGFWYGFGGTFGVAFAVITLCMFFRVIFPPVKKATPGKPK